MAWPLMVTSSHPANSWLFTSFSDLVQEARELVKRDALGRRSAR